MQTYMVLYREAGMAPLDAPLGFRCVADDCMHAEEQCENANPGCDIVWVAITDSIGDALAEYWETNNE